MGSPINRSLATAVRSRTVTAVVLVTATALIVALAVTATGYPVNHVSANDGGVWLVDDTAGTGFAEMNVPIQQLGAHFGDPGSSSVDALDVLQQGTSILAVDEHKQVVYPVDEEAGTVDAEHGVTLAGGATSTQGQIGGGHVALGGGTVAILDPGTSGKPARLWAAAVGNGPEASLAGVEQSVKPLATLNGGQAIAVDDQGDVFSASTTELVEYPAESNGLGAPVKTAFPRPFSSVELTTVGTDPVVFDPTKESLYFPDSGATSQLTSTGPVALQQSGPAAPSVLVGLSTGLLVVPLGGGSPSSVATVPGGGGRPAQPVALDGCDYDAWAGSPGYDVEACPGSAPSEAKPATALSYESQSNNALTDPVLRVNNNFVVLNDAYDGGAWLVAGSPSEVLDNDDWLKVFAGDKPSNSNNPQGQTTASQAEKPQLHNPTLYARAGQQSVLHILDGDTDPNFSPLSITDVTPTTGPGYSIAISPNTETLVFTLQPGATVAVSFTYSVVDGKGETASGPVTVDVTTKESPPAPMKPQPEIHVVSGGTVSFGVLSNWRDPESDPISLAQAQASAGQVSWTGDGTVTYTAASLTDQAVTLTYLITDGRSAPVSQTEQVVVVGSSDSTAYAPTAEPDVAKVVVGEAASISPLDNDLFGADPANPGAKLALAGQVTGVTDLTVTTNTVSGQLTVDAAQAGSYLLTYQDAFGSAPLSIPAVILVVAIPPPTATPPPPVTTPLSVLVHGTNPTTVDVLQSDFDPAGGLLTVTGLVTPMPTGIQASVQDGEFIRIAVTSPPSSSAAPVPQILNYIISDGQQTANGQVSVTEEPALATTPPVVPLTYATVRTGNEVDVPVLATASDPDGESISLLNGGSQTAAVQLSETEPSQSGYRSGLGTGSLSGAYLRYLAPPATGVATPETVTASFIVEAADGTRTTGQTIITVLPASTADTEPQPIEVDARVAAGGTVNIPVPTTGVDPDGQDVTVTGVTSSPSLGQVVAVKATSIEYQAYPVSSTSGAFSGGTDTFSYQVTSPSGQSAQANVRVGVTPPSAVQAPVAVDHFATGSPGKPVQVDLLSGDVIAPGDQVTVESLSAVNHPLPDGARLIGNGDILQVNAPAGAVPLDLAYGITDGTAAPSVAHVIVRAQPRYASAPVAADYYPQLPSRTAKSLMINVLTKDSDPAASANDLVIVDPPVRNAVIKGPNLVLPVGPSPTAIPYTVESKVTGQKAVGVVHVPGNGSGLQLGSGSIHVPEGGSKAVDLAAFITDPGHTVRITTTDEVKASPTFGLSEQVTGNESVKLVGSPGYQGPGSLVVQVTDAASLSSPGAHVQTFAIPVVVGTPTAIVRCPQNPIDLVQGGRSVSASINSLCQVWTPGTTESKSTTFTESWAHQAAGVNLSYRPVWKIAVSRGRFLGDAGASGQISVGRPGRWESRPVRRSISSL